MSVIKFAKIIDDLVKELDGDSYWKARDFQSKVTLAIGYLHAHTLMYIDSPPKPVEVKPDNPKFTETDMLGNAKKKYKKRPR